MLVGVALAGCGRGDDAVVVFAASRRRPGNRAGRRALRSRDRRTRTGSTRARVRCSSGSSNPGRGPTWSSWPIRAGWTGSSEVGSSSPDRGGICWGNSLVFVTPAGDGRAIDPGGDGGTARAERSRPEIPRTCRWGGTPSKPCENSGGGTRSRAGWFRRATHGRRFGTSNSARSIPALSTPRMRWVRRVRRRDSAFPRGFHDPIVYPAASTTGGRGRVPRVPLDAGGVRGLRTLRLRGGALMLTESEWSAIGLSLRVAAVSVVVMTPIGVGLAWALGAEAVLGQVDARRVGCTRRSCCRRWSSGFCSLLLLGRNGPIGAPLNGWFGIELAFTWWGAVIASGGDGVAADCPPGAARVRAGRPAAGRGGTDARRAAAYDILPGEPAAGVARRADGCGARFRAGASASSARRSCSRANIEGATRTLPLAIYTESQTPGGDAALWRLVAIAAVLSLGSVLASQWLVSRGTPMKLEIDIAVDVGGAPHEYRLVHRCPTLGFVRRVGRGQDDAAARDRGADHANPGVDHRRRPGAL